MGRKEANSTFNEAISYNKATFNDYFLRLKLLALNMFKYENLPKGIPERFIEKTVQNIGLGIFFEDPEKGIIFSKATPSGMLNLYDEPICYHAYSHILNRSIKSEDCVVLRNNAYEMPMETTIRLFSQRLYEAERTIDVNVKAQKTPLLLFGNDKNILAMRNLYMQIDGNMPACYINEKLNIDQIKALNTTAPLVALDLQKYKHEIYNEVLTFLGINNANTDKKERLITDEVEANNQLISMNAETLLSSRQEAINQLNEKFNLDVKVSLRYKPKKKEEKEEKEEDE